MDSYCKKIEKTLIEPWGRSTEILQETTKLQESEMILVKNWKSLIEWNLQVVVEIFARFC